MGWSIELCGGTHVSVPATSASFPSSAILAVGAGVRRIEALTAKSARANANHFVRLAKATASELRVPADDVPSRVAALMDERKNSSANSPTPRRNSRWGAAARATAPTGFALSATSS